MPRCVSVRRNAFSLEAWYLLVKRPERVADCEPNHAARCDSGEEHPIFQFEGKQDNAPDDLWIYHYATSMPETVRAFLIK